MQIYYHDGKVMKTVNVFNFTGTYILNNLTPSTQYSIYVRAVRIIEVTQMLEGNSSVMATAKTMGREFIHTVHNNNHTCTHTYICSLMYLSMVNVNGR